ncbi:MAG: S9 family peptidase [Candidatus Neomarinimicrobiota bacterium]
MKKLVFLTLLLALPILPGFGQVKDLTLDDIFLNRTLKNASLHEWKWHPDGTAYVFFDRDSVDVDYSIYRVDNVSGDTTLFLSDSQIQYEDQRLKPTNYWLPDKGDKVLIQTKRKRIWRHSRSGIYYVFDLKREKMIQLADGERLRNVKLAPGGKMAAYVRADNNLYVVDMNRFKERQLTKDGSKDILNGHLGWVYEEEFGSHDGYRWSPDGQKIAFWREDQSNVRSFTLMDEMGQYPETQEIHYPKVGETNPTMDIGIVDVRGGRTRWLDINNEEEVYLPLIRWEKIPGEDNAGSDLFVYSTNRLQNYLEIFRFNVKSGRGERLITDSSKAWLSILDDIQFFSDGSFIRASEKSGFNHIYHYSAVGELINQVTDGNWEVSLISGVNADEQKVFFTGKRESVIESNLYSVNLDGTGLQLLSDDPGWHIITMNEQGTYYIDSFSSASVPVKFSLHENSGQKVRDISITKLGQYEDFGWNYPEFLNIKTSDNGTVLNAMIRYPRNFDPSKKYPVIVYGYAGPGSQVVVDRWDRRGWHQYLSQLGFIVFSVDNRGTGGRGTDFKYLAYMDIGKWPVHDHIEGVKYLRSLPYVDPGRIGVWGWSGGGYLTIMCMTKGAPYFQAGVAVAPVTDLRLYDTIWTERYMGLLSENQAGYENASAFTYQDRLAGDLLIIHGTRDDNVHPQHTLQYMKKAVDGGKQVDMLYYPNKNHSIRGRKTQHHLYTYMTDYFLEKLMK